MGGRASKGSECVRVCVFESAVCEVCQAGDYRFRARQTVLNLRLISCFGIASVDSPGRHTAYVAQMKSWLWLSNYHIYKSTQIR